MPCKTLTIGGHRTTICSPTVLSRTRETMYCRDCKKQAKHVVEHRDYYGLVRCCLKCGRVQTNEGMGWRYESLPGGYEARKQRAENIRRFSEKPLIEKETI